MYLQCDKTIHNNVTISRFVEEINNGEYLLSYPGQRKADQWDTMKKSMLITSFLFGEDIDSIKISEKIIDGMHIYYIIDGMQRTSTIMEFIENRFKLHKDIDMPIYTYHRIVKDEDGRIIFTDNGIPKKEICEYDLRGKKWKDFPEEVKKCLMDYNIQTVKHLECTDERIAHDIIRYNNSQSMNTTQSAMARVNIDYARRIRDIVENNPLFVDHIGLTSAQRIKSVPERIVMEAIMATKYMDGWNKTTAKVANYLNKYSQVSDYEEIAGLMARLADVLSEDSDELFTAKNAYTFIALFSRFEAYDLATEKFNEFLEKFIDELQYVEVDGVVWADIDTRNSKDKATVQKRLDYLETLMVKMFDIKECKVSDDDIARVNEYFDMPVDIIEKTLSILFGKKRHYSSEEIDDLIFYRNCLEDWLCHCGCEDKDMLVIDIPNMINTIAYVYKNDINEAYAINVFAENWKTTSDIISLITKDVA